VTSSRINSAFCKMGAMFILLAFAIMACLPTLSAQELSATKGGLAGLVTDSSGAVVPTASVTVTGNSDTRKVNTNDAGRWEVLDLTPGGLHDLGGARGL
jgi:hypothetical protein